MSIAAAEMAPALAGSAETGATSGGFLGRVGNFLAGANSSKPVVPSPKPAPVGTAATVASGTVNPLTVL